MANNGGYVKGHRPVCEGRLREMLAMPSQTCSTCRILTSRLACSLEGHRIPVQRDIIGLMQYSSVMNIKATTMSGLYGDAFQAAKAAGVEGCEDNR